MRHLIAGITIVFLLASYTALSLDVGVIDLTNEEGHEWNNIWTDSYPEGTEFTCVAAVENFGSEPQHDVQVSLKIYDVTMEPDSLVWQDTEVVGRLEKRSIGESDQIEVRFPVFNVPSDDWFRFECRTELDDDEDPENDKYTTNVNMATVEECIEYAYMLESIVPDSVFVSTRISYAIPWTTHVSLTVWDVRDKLIRTLVEGIEGPGRHIVTWDRKNNRGRKVSAGIYLVCMEADEFEATRKVVVID
ncbi:hypothetical protein JXM67_15010 [candidate division WOR-3 bacterium]|nr:hypothetical protein [candidate division WOR-3 bacterium]